MDNLFANRNLILSLPEEADKVIESIPLEEVGTDSEQGS